VMMRGLVMAGPRLPTGLQPKFRTLTLRRLTARGGIAGAAGFWLDRRRLTQRNPDLRVTSIDQQGSMTPAVRAIESTGKVRPNCDIGRAGSGRPLSDPTADLGTSRMQGQKSGGPEPQADVTRRREDRGSVRLGIKTRDARTSEGPIRTGPFRVLFRKKACAIRFRGALS
jgi:hypothetical protein